MDSIRLANYVAGIDPGPIEAWRLDSDLATVLKLNGPTDVLLSDWTLTKTTFRHPEINFQDYEKLPTIFSLGFIVAPPPGAMRRARSLEFFYSEHEPLPQRGWRVCLKATASNEVFITTFHHTDWKEMKRVYGRAIRTNRLLRDAQTELAQRLLRRASNT